MPGERAKLIFLFDGEQPDAPGGERMWVEIEAVEDGVFQGGSPINRFTSRR
ncbi:hypothetical protein HML84_20025 [Alcanivorax sp. IO_7]|nr:hypothetical protein HML84_20025 [Alcanivorax sp. IO_7]